jgi:hypothetical protein
MSNFILSGKYLGAGKTQEVGANKFKVRRFWLDCTTNPQYPNTPELQLSGLNVTMVDGLSNGQEIEVSVRLDGRKFKNKEGKEGIINSLVVWKVSVIKKESVGKTEPDPEIVTEPTNTDEDLPF